ncbi:RodZ domain-containing protein [Litoribrevibacter euphylliae]|uniref:RodZ domain-containing protein n=1 Tax=Litoribrevibacter euphylliae TaxID=1834034 RepID=A0ABV7H8I8_9GAMM
MTDQSLHEVGHKSSLPVGKILASARSEQGMTTDMVAARLCLTEGYIKALEAGQYETLPGDTFIRGYLRNYADIVGLNGEELVRIYIEQQNSAREAEALEASQRQKSSGSNKLPILGLAIVILVVIAVVIGLGMEEGKNSQSDSTSTATEPEISSSEAENVQSVEANSSLDVVEETTPESRLDEEQPSDPVTSDESEVTEEMSVNEQPEQDMLESVSEIEADSEDLQAEEQVLADVKEELSFTFTGDCWYQVVDSTGAKLAERTKSAGDTSSVEGIPPFTITLGDTTAVELMFQGQSVDLSPYFERKSARFKVGG